MSKSRSRFSTRLIQGGREPSRQGGFVNPPVYHGSTVIHETLAEMEDWHAHHGERNRVGYGRFGSPTTLALENAMAELENGFGGIAVSSGLAAVTTTLLAYLDAGDHALVADTVYGPTRKFCLEFLAAKGIETGGQRHGLILVHVGPLRLYWCFCANSRSMLASLWCKNASL